MNKTNIIITGEDFDYSFDELKAMEVNIFHYPMIFTSGININIDPSIYNYIIFTSKKWCKIFSKKYFNFSEQRYKIYMYWGKNC